MKRTILYLLILVFVFSMVTTKAAAQDPSDIFLVKMNRTDSAFRFGTPEKISTEKGYNNQPYFGPDSSFLLYSSEENKQTDVFKYLLASKKTVQLTATPQSEYSPTPMADGKRFSVIQQINTEGPDKGAQKLMAFPFVKGEPTLLFYEKEKKVGYHAWIDGSRMAMFILGEPHTLQLIDIKTKKARIAAGNIGRSIYVVPGKKAVSFTHYEGSKDGVIKTVDVETLKLTSLVPMKSGGEYYAWTAKGELLMAVGSKLFKYKPGKDKEWQEVADFSGKGINKITRLAVAPDGRWLALVSEK